MTNAIRRDIITALPIAFHEDGRLNLEGTRQIVHKAAGTGVQGAFVLGTTGEFVSLSFEERRQILEVATAELSELRCIVHVGAASLFEVLRYIEQARSVGATEIAVLTPYYLPVTDAEILKFFTAVSAASDGLDVYVYVFRARTGNFVSTELMAQIATLPNIVGGKISGEPLEQVAAYRAVVPEDFILYTGADIDVARVADYGGQGVISGNASTLPKPFTDMVAALANGADADTQAQAQAAIADVCDVLQGDMARMKAALRLQGLDAGYPRMQLGEPDAAGLAELKRAVQQYDTLAPV